MNLGRGHLVVGSLVLGITVLFLVPLRAPVSGTANPAAEELSPERARLLELLGRHRRAWQPEERLAVIAEIRGAAALLSEPMRWLLAKEDHEYLPEAAAVAGDLGLAELRPRLLRLAQQGPARVRPQAIFGAAKLGPWDPPELAGLLLDPDPAVQVAAVRACALTGARLVSAMIPLLSSTHGEVREAVVESLPEPLTEDELRDLVTFAMETSGPGQVAALRALRRGADDPEVETALMGLALGRDPLLRRGALESLGARGQPLGRPGEVLELALDSRLPLEDRSAAMWCLESTRSPVMERLQQEVPHLPPEMRYFAGRYLLAMGDRTGAPVLLDLLDELEYGSTGLDEKAAGSLTHETRRSLAVASRLDMATPVPDWRRYFEELERLVAVSFPAPALSFELPASGR